MDDHQGSQPPLQQQPSQEPHQPPQQPYQPQQQYQPQQRQVQQQQPLQQPPQQLYQAQQPYQQYDAAASIAQSTAAMNAVAAQMANLATVLVQNQNTAQAGGIGTRGIAAGPPNDNYGPTLKPSDVATFKPRSQSDADSTSRFIDCIRDAVAHYGEPRTRAVLRRYCKGSVAEDWIAGVSDHDRALLRMNCSNWTAILERDFMPYLASRLSTARAEAFRWSQGRTPTEYVAKKLRLLQMANTTTDDEVVEELHRGFAAAPNLHLHLDKYVSEIGNSVSEYRRTVVHLQDSARRDGDTLASQPRIGTRRRPFRELTGVSSSNAGQRPAASAITSARDAVAAPGTVVRTAPRKQPREHLRKCRNYPECGDGEHWDWQCIIKRTASNQVRRTYYAEPLDCESDDSDDDVNGLSHDVLEPQADLEEEYNRAQNGYFTTRYREEKGLGFLGTLAAPRTGQLPVQCRNCHAVFPSKNKLHDHLRARCRPASEPPAGNDVIVKSTAPVLRGLVEGLTDFHYAKSFWYTSPGGTSHVACIDSGFGNSAVDQELQRRLYPDAQLLPLPPLRVVEGLGGAECTATHMVVLKIFMKGTDGRFTELLRPFHIFKDLSVPLLIGNDTIKPEKFDLLYSSNCLCIGSCDGIQVQITVHSGHRFTRIPV